MQEGAGTNVSSETLRIASIGSTDSSHCERDFFRGLQLPLDVHDIKTVAKSDDGLGQEVEADVPILYPHELWIYLVTTARIVIDMAEVTKYWSHFRGLKVPWAMEHPADSGHIPIGLYGDDVQYTKTGEKLTGLLIDCPLIRFVNGWLCRFPFFVLRWARSCGHRPSAHPSKTIFPKNH